MHHYLWTEQTVLNCAFFNYSCKPKREITPEKQKQKQSVGDYENLEKWQIFVCLHSFVYLQSLVQLVQIEERGLEDKGGVIT